MAPSRVLASLLVLATVAVMLPGEASAMDCGQVFSAVTPCINYLKSGGRPPSGCCTGVRNLASAANSPSARQTACTCLKSAASRVSGLNLKLAAALPGACGVSIPYKISPSTDCSKVH